MSTTPFAFRRENRITFSDLKTYVLSYIDSLNGVNDTTSCLIDLSTLKNLMSYISRYNKRKKSTTPAIGAIRIYLIRSEDKRFKRLDDGRPQIGFAIVPVSDYVAWGQGAPLNVKGNDAKHFDDDSIIYAIIPGLSNEGSGLCPDNCTGSIGKGGG